MHKTPFPPMYICTYHAFITHRFHCCGNMHINTAHTQITTPILWATNQWILWQAALGVHLNPGVLLWAVSRAGVHVCQMICNVTSQSDTLCSVIRHPVQRHKAPDSLQIVGWQALWSSVCCAACVGHSYWHAQSMWCFDAAVPSSLAEQLLEMQMLLEEREAKFKIYTAPY